MAILGKKFKNKIKEEVKKELIEAQDRESKKRKEDELRKERLIEEENRIKDIHNSKEDLEVIKQKMIYATIIVVCVIICLIVYLVYSFNGFSLFPKKSDVDVEPVEKDVLYMTLDELSIGEVSTSNIYVDRLIEEVSLNWDDYKIFDTTSLFAKKSTLISELPISSQLFLLSKTYEFENLISKLNLKSEAEVCYRDKSLVIDSNDIKSLLKKKFNLDSSLSSFKYNYYDGTVEVTKVEFELEGDKFYSYCILAEDFNRPSVIASNRVISAYKTEDEIVLNTKVVFLTADAIYKDYELKEVIYDENSDTNLDYTLLGSTYMYVYKKDSDNNYYLYSIDLKEE